MIQVREGGAGSGDFGHAGRVGVVGGSAPSIDDDPDFNAALDRVKALNYSGTLYHGTTEAAKQNILANGFKIDPKRYGQMRIWGDVLYLTDSINYAAMYAKGGRAGLVTVKADGLRLADFSVRQDLSDLRQMASRIAAKLGVNDSNGGVYGYDLKTDAIVNGLKARGFDGMFVRGISSDDEKFVNIFDTGLPVINKQHRESKAAADASSFFVWNTDRLKPIGDLTEAAATQALANVNKAINTLSKGIYRKYYIGLEVMVLRYQRDMWRTIMSYSRQLSDAAHDQGFDPILQHMVNDLATLGSRTLHQAASVGFERALNDLRLWGYVSTFPSPVVAPPHLSKQAIDENDRYLQKSLLPYMRGVFKKVAQPDEVVPALASIHARVKQYGHYVWRASERAFISGLRELMDARRTHMGMREGGTGSGDFAHAGRPGEVGGSAHGVDLEVPKEFDKVLHNPQFKKTFDTLLQNPDLQTEHFKGTVYHGIEDMDRKRDRHAAAVLKGKEPFYNTTQGAYGPGLYFATSEREASAYGRHMFSTELDGKLLHMNDYDYVHRFANKLDEVARSLGFSVSVFGEVANYALKGYGYDGLRISFGEKTDTVHSPDYLVDVNASKLKFGYEGPLTEAEQRGDVIVLFKAPTGEVTWLR